uniref:Putative secreted protein n=1 Tax=Anopheles marajoara TaxID=58244 RepID=A0A2M4C769_9DIPT
MLPLRLLLLLLLPMMPVRFGSVSFSVHPSYLHHPHSGSSCLSCLRFTEYIWLVGSLPGRSGFLSIVPSFPMHIHVSASSSSTTAATAEPESRFCFESRCTCVCVCVCMYLYRCVRVALCCIAVMQR